MADLPRRAVTRSARLASLPLGFAGRTAIGLGKRVGGRPAEAVAAEVQQRTAEQLFKVLGELKGGAMKFGQALSVFEAALPEELAGPYRATLVKLQDAAPPMPAATVHAVLAEDLGPRWRQRFQSFEDFPAAAASIGQVHRAVWKDGRDVAVKVQYPGAGPALISDLNQVARVARVAAGWIPGLDIKPIMDELKARVSEELDYKLEAKSQAAFAKAFAGHPRFAVPAVIASGERVIVAEWLEGRPLSRLISSGTQAERDAAAALYLEFLLAGPRAGQAAARRPAPGQLPDDAGRAARDPGLRRRQPAAQGPAAGDRAAAVDRDARRRRVGGGGAARGGLHQVLDRHRRRRAAGLPAAVHGAAAGADRFQFTRAWLRGLFQHVHDPRRPQWAVGLKLNLPPSYLLIHRVWLGGIGVLCQLEGEVPAREILAANLPGLDLPPL